MAKAGKTNTGDLWWALKQGPPEPPPPHPAVLEPMRRVDPEAEPLDTAVSTMVATARSAGWDVVVTRAVGTILHLTGKRGELAESLAVRVRGPVQHSDVGPSSRRAGVAIYLRKLSGKTPAATATFEGGWWWRVDRSDHALVIPRACGATGLTAWIRHGTEPLGDTTGSDEP